MNNPMRTSVVLSSLIAIMAPAFAELGLLRHDHKQDVVAIVHNLLERE